MRTELRELGRVGFRDDRPWEGGDPPSDRRRMVGVARRTSAAGQANSDPLLADRSRLVVMRWMCRRLARHHNLLASAGLRARGALSQEPFGTR